MFLSDGIKQITGVCGVVLEEGTIDPNVIRCCRLIGRLLELGGVSRIPSVTQIYDCEREALVLSSAVFHCHNNYNRVRVSICVCVRASEWACVPGAFCLPFQLP